MAKRLEQNISVLGDFTSSIRKIFIQTNVNKIYLATCTVADPVAALSKTLALRARTFYRGSNSA